jgi:hypothetical protein
LAQISAELGIHVVALRWMAVKILSRAWSFEKELPAAKKNSRCE